GELRSDTRRPLHPPLAGHLLPKGRRVQPARGGGDGNGTCGEEGPLIRPCGAPSPEGRRVHAPAVAAITTARTAAIVGSQPVMLPQPFCEAASAWARS